MPCAFSHIIYSFFYILKILHMWHQLLLHLYMRKIICARLGENYYCSYSLAIQIWAFPWLNYPEKVTFSRSLLYFQRGSRICINTWCVLYKLFSSFELATLFLFGIKRNGSWWHFKNIPFSQKIMIL